MKNKEPLLLTEFDIATSGIEIQMLKAFVPFAEPAQQKNLALCIRMMEFMKTMDFYNNMTSPCPLSRSSRDKKDIFNEIKKFCPKKDMEIFEMMANMDNISEYLKMYEAMSSPKSENKQTDILKNFLSPEQQKMFESYENMLNL